MIAQLRCRICEHEWQAGFHWYTWRRGSEMMQASVLDRDQRTCRLCFSGEWEIRQLDATPGDQL